MTTILFIFLFFASLCTQWHELQSNHDDRGNGMEDDVYRIFLYDGSYFYLGTRHGMEGLDQFWDLSLK
ncbi:hypothetical protein LXL04_022639 [Taraxacum kok-saghyz]